MPTDFRELIDDRLITLDLKSENGTAAIEELASLMDQAGKLRSRADFVQAVYQREALTTTATDEWGIAIPHARSVAVKEPAICFGRSCGMLWDDESANLVQLVFLIAVPASKPSSDYIETLAALARALVDDDFRKRLMEAHSKEQVIDAIASANKIGKVG